MTTTHNLTPTRASRVFNGLVAQVTTLGISLWGSRVLSVAGRVTGQPRTNPVNVLDLASARYLVAPRGQTQWVRNLRVAQAGSLRVGKRVEQFTAIELADVGKPAILRAYLRRWKFEVGAFFDGVDATATDDELRRIAHAYPVFRVYAEHR